MCTVPYAPPYHPLQMSLDIPGTAMRLWSAYSGLQRGELTLVSTIRVGHLSCLMLQPDLVGNLPSHGSASCHHLQTGRFMQVSGMYASHPRQTTEPSQLTRFTPETGTALGGLLLPDCPIARAAAGSEADAPSSKQLPYSPS